MGHETHSHGARSNERSLWLALSLTAGFMVVEIVGGLVTGSLALLSDASHMATDVFGIGLALAALRFGSRPADSKRTFGYARLEILAAVANAALLIVLAAYIVYEAARRLFEPPHIQSTAMLVIALIGLVVNIAAMRMLGAGKEQNLNIRGAYLEVWSDFIGSIGVIAAALVIRLTGWTVVDTIVAVGIGLWVLPRTWMLLNEALNLLLEGVPRGLALDEVREAMSRTKGVTDVHDLHVWAVTGERIYLTAHVVAPSRADDHEELVSELARDLAARFGIRHVTIQFERAPCPSSELALP